MTDTTTQTVIQQANLPAWYTSYLQQVMGRALTQAGSGTPALNPDGTPVLDAQGNPVMNAIPPPTQQVAPLTDLQNQGIGVIQGAQGSATPYYNQAGDAFNRAQ